MGIKKNLFKKNNLFLQIIFILFILSACTTTKKGGGVFGDNDYMDDIYRSNLGDINDINSIAYFENKIGNKIYFDLNEYELNSESISLLNSKILWIQKHPNYKKIIIEGHCDERGTREYNIALGEKRAFEIKKYLINNGLNNHKISIISYGKEKPDVIGSYEEAFSMNRRGVIILE